MLLLTACNTICVRSAASASWQSALSSEAIDKRRVQVQKRPPRLLILRIAQSALTGSARVQRLGHEAPVLVLTGWR